MKSRLLPVIPLGTLFVVTLILGSTAMSRAEDTKVRERSEIDKKYLWATDLTYPTMDAWEKDFAALAPAIDKLTAFQGKLGTGADQLLAFFQLRDDVSPRFEKVAVHASLLAAQDTRDSKPQALEARVRDLIVKFGQATAWVDSEITAIPWETIETWLKSNKDLGMYRHALENLFRQKKHILSPREEELIALGGRVAAVPSTAYELLTNSDIKFPTIKDDQGRDFELSDSAFYIMMDNPDRRVRKDAYEGIVGTYRQYRNTAAALLSGQVQSHIFNIKARGYKSSLEAALEPANIPAGVYNNLVKAVNDNLPLLHRYTTLRKTVLKLPDGAHDYDLYVSLTREGEATYTYEDATKLMLTALTPLGPDYNKTVAEGVTSRWIDVFPTKGKQSGAFSSGTFLTQPFILLNFYGRYDDVSTLCHEMGHSMHSHLSHATQPYVYGDYDIFCAEVASTTNEVLLQQEVLKQTKDPKVKLHLLGRFLEGFRGTVFRQTMFSEFEQAIHEMAERGEPLTADSLGTTYGGIMKKYYGPNYAHDELVDNYWIRIPHFYRNFYVYKYATSYCAAVNIAARIAAGEPGAVDAYLGFLKGGSSKYPVDLLKGARVDMSTPAPMNDAMKYFEDLLNQTEQLLKDQGGA